MTHPHVADPWDVAEKAQPPTYTHFGQITCQADNVIWPRGTRLADCPPFNQNQHKSEDRVVRIVIMATPLPGRTNPYPHERTFPAYAREWTIVTKPSLEAIGIAPRDVDGKYAQYQFKPARKYTDSNGNEKEATSFHFVEFYDTEKACIEAAEKFFGNGNNRTEAFDPNDIPFGDEDDEVKASGNGADADPEREAMAQFLPAFWQQCNGNVDEFAKKIAENAMLAQYFTVDSPEVQALVNPQ